ncbi:MAG: hypothetical protein ACTSW2_05705 [Alphaproteobacteria bacterium]
MHKIFSVALAATAIIGALIAPVRAEPIKIEAVLAPKEQMRLDFADGSKRFVLLVRREGTAAGSGPLDGAAVTEYGMHDITRGVDGDPRGFLEFTDAAGGKAYVKWQVRAVFVPGAEDKPKLLDYGYWELVGGTGAFAGMKGLGTLRIKAASKTDRRFILEGELVPGT